MLIAVRNRPRTSSYYPDLSGYRPDTVWIPSRAVRIGLLSRAVRIPSRLLRTVTDSSGRSWVSGLWSRAVRIGLLSRAVRIPSRLLRTVTDSSGRSWVSGLWSRAVRIGLLSRAVRIPSRLLRTVTDSSGRSWVSGLWSRAVRNRPELSGRYPDGIRTAADGTGR